MNEAGFPVFFLLFFGEITSQYLCLIKQAQLFRFHSCFSCMNFVHVLLEGFGVGVGSHCLHTQARWTRGSLPWTRLREAAETTLTCRPRRGEESHSEEWSWARLSMEQAVLSKQSGHPSPRTRSRTVTTPAVSGDLLPPGLGLSAAAPHLAGRSFSARVAPGAVFPDMLSRP